MQKLVHEYALILLGEFDEIGHTAMKHPVHYKTMCFALYTGGSASSVVHQLPPRHQILKQPANGALTAELMRSYVSLRRREMAGWLELPGAKSNTLRRALSQGAALLVLDRRRPLAPAADLQTLAPVGSRGGGGGG